MTIFGVGLVNGTYPFIAAKNFTNAHRLRIDIVVIHTMEAPEKPGTARGVATWFGSAAGPQASAHYCVDENEIIQCVLEKDVAWHAPGANSNGIGIEHAGFAKFTNEDWERPGPANMLAFSAGLVAEICDRYQIPVKKLTVADLRAGGARGICGHKDITDAFNDGKGHWDPGPCFPWDSYTKAISEASPGGA